MPYTILACGKNDPEESIFVFDSITSYSERFKSSVTRYSVEKEADKSDHVQVHNGTISISGIIQRNPLPNRNGNTQDNNLVTSYNDRASGAKALLRQMRDDREEITIVSEFDTHEHYYITSLNFPKTVVTTGYLEVSMTLEQLRESTVELVSISNVASGLEDDVALEKPTGTANKRSTNDSESRTVRALTEYYNTVRPSTGDQGNGEGNE